MKKINRKWWIIAAIAILALIILAKNGKKKKEEISFKTEKVSTANIQNSITATGTIEPVISVTVGTQVSGIVSKLYVDYKKKKKKARQDKPYKPVEYSQSKSQ